MNSKLEILSPITATEWNTLVLSSSNYSVFHSAEWINVIRTTYNYKPLFIVYKESEAIAALIPAMIVKSIITNKRIVTLPFSDYCAPLQINGKDVFKDLLNELLNYSKSQKFSSLEIRGGNNFFNNADSFNHFYLHNLQLNKNEDELLACFRDSTRRNIKKASREGVTVRVENSLEAVNGFYSMNCITRRYHGLPPQPRALFRNIFLEFISKKKGTVISAFYKGERIASNMFLQFGNKVIYKYGASNRLYQNLRANNLVMWEAIKYYNNLEYKELSLGKTNKENIGLRRFKLGWGASEEIVNIFKYDFSKNKYIYSKSYTVGFHNHIFRVMPLAILKLIGRIMYKHIG